MGALHSYASWSLAKWRLRSTVRITSAVISTFLFPFQLSAQLPGHLQPSAESIIGRYPDTKSHVLVHVRGMCACEHSNALQQVSSRVESEVSISPLSSIEKGWHEHAVAVPLSPPPLLH